MLTTVVGSGGRFDNGSAEAAVLEILKAVEEAMSRFGLAGRLRIEGRNLVLDGPGIPASVPLELLVDQWPGLAPDARARRCQDIARRLQQQRHGAVSLTPRANRLRLSPTVVLGLVGVTLLALALVLAPRFVNYSPPTGPARTPAATAAANPATESTASSVAAYEAERRARALRVCQATQSRVLRGATVGPTDVEGWVLELMLFSEGNQDWLTAPALTEFIQQGPDQAWRVVWPTATDLVSLEGPGTEVSVEPLSLTRPTDAPATAQTHTGLQINFFGRYVIPYFRETERINYIRLSVALSDRLNAKYGALYARCDGEQSHHLGTWFRGPSPDRTAAVLMFAMSGHALVPHLQATVLSPDPTIDLDPGHCWHQLATHSAGLTRARIVSLISPAGGMIAGRADGGTTSITFPFKDANRAERSSLAIAQELGIAVVR